jgi:hypothetical protein
MIAMRDYLKRHLPILVAAVIVAGLMTTGPAAARAVYDTVNAHTVDGKHAVSSNSTVAHRAGKLVATNAAGRLPDNIIARSPDSAKLGGLPLSAFAPTILYSSGPVEPTGPICETASFTPTRPSFAVIQLDVDVMNEVFGHIKTFAVAPGYSTNDGASYNYATPKTPIVASAAANNFGSVGATGVVRLAAGRAYRFAVKVDHFPNVTLRDGGCEEVVEILPKFPGSKIIGPCGTTVCPPPKDGKLMGGSVPRAR